MIWLLLVLSVSLVSSIDGFKLHEHLTEEEIQSVFHHEYDVVNELDYEVVNVLHTENDLQKNNKDGLHSKSTQIVQLVAFSRNYTLYLEENDGVLLGEKTPLFLANVVNGVINYTKIKYPMTANFGLYHDIDNRAALTIHKASDNKVHVDGIIGDNLIIRPLPARVHEEVLPEHPLVKNLDFIPHGRIAHVVYRPTRSTPNVVMESSHSSSTQSSNPIESHLNQISVHSTVRPSTTTRRSTSQRLPVTQPSLISKLVPSEKTVYPELLITCDYGTYTSHRRNATVVAKYMAAFWNAVDLRFRAMKNPKIRLNIAGLIIPQSLNAAAYMEKHIVNRSAIYNLKTMQEIQTYFGNEKKFSKTMYDIVIAISHRKIGTYENGKFKGGIAGSTYLGSACLQRKGSSVVLVSDNGAYKGVITAAHEVAHTLDAKHDGPDTTKLPGGPCAEGYLMSYEHRKVKGLQWSQCSISSMRSFLKSKRAKCLRNKPDVGTTYPKILPGKILSRDEQCNRTMGMVSYKKREWDCTVLWCAKYEGKRVPFRTIYRPPAEGSSCAKGGICLDGMCVKDPETRY